MPLRRPMKAGNDINVNRLASVSVPVPGFKINTVPVSAASTQASWYGFAFLLVQSMKILLQRTGIVYLTLKHQRYADGLLHKS